MCAVSLLGYFPVRVLVCAELWRWQHSAGSGGNSFSLHKGASEQNNVGFFFYNTDVLLHGSHFSELF